MIPVLFAMVVIGSILFYGYLISEPEPLFTRYIYVYEPPIKLPQTELEEENEKTFKIMCDIADTSWNKMEETYSKISRKLGY